MDLGILLAILGSVAFLLGSLFLIAFTVFVIFVIFVFLVTVCFMQTGKVLLPRVTIFALNFIEDPLNRILSLIGVRTDGVSTAVVDIRNAIFDQIHSKVVFKDRMIFLPYCLRSRQCPAKLEEDGLICLKCGKCDISRIKTEAESLGYGVFIVPGSSLIKKIIKKYKPKAVIGVGCHSEVREGTNKMAAIGMPAKGLILNKDGCIDTEVDVERLIILLKK
jgi:hypothetical protein